MKKLLLLAFLTVGISLLLSCSGGGDIKIDDKNFPDEIFREYVSKKFDTDNDKRLSKEEIFNATTIILNDERTAIIASLKGIEHFNMLSVLRCNSSELSELDLNSNVVMTELVCPSPKLISLQCHVGDLTRLDVSQNTALKELNCSLNKISTLDLSKNTDLEKLDISGNKISQIDLRANVKLTNLAFGSDDMTELDISNSNKLEFLSCYNCPNLQIIWVWDEFNLDDPESNFAHVFMKEGVEYRKKQVDSAIEEI